MLKSRCLGTLQLRTSKFDGSLEFVHEYGGNESKPSYQEASGAPVETISSLGLQVTWFSTILLNIGQMIGTGVFSTRKFLLISHTDSDFD